MVRSVSRFVLPAAAAVTNFGAVLLGLWAISAFTNDHGAQVALLNVWAIWGVGLGLWGNAGLLSAKIDNEPWHRPRHLALAAVISLTTAVLLASLQRQLFDSRASWGILCSVSIGAVYILGRQRGSLTLARRGGLALGGTALENVLRALLLLFVLQTGNTALGALAIVAPIGITFFAFTWLVRADPPLQLDASPKSGHSIAHGLLAGIPAVLAYGVVPGLTLLGQTTDLDLIALTATVLRGPLVVVAFLAPWILQRVDELSVSRRRRTIGVSCLIVVAQVVVSFLADLDNLAALISSAGAAAISALGAYFVVMTSTAARGGTTPLSIGAVAALVSMALLVVLRGESDALTFLPVSIGSLTIAGLLELTTPSDQAGGSVDKEPASDDTSRRPASSRIENRAA